MKFFKRNDLSDAGGERMPSSLEADCLGLTCPNWRGEACTSGFEWAVADATVTKGRDTSKPPFISETRYVIYGQICTAANEKDMVAQRVEVLHIPEGGIMEISAMTASYGDMPVEINYAGTAATLLPLVDSMRPEDKPQDM